MPTPTALVLLHPNVEELEAVAPIDMLRRAGVEVCVASLTGDKTVRGRSGLVLETERPFAHVLDRLFDALVLPGGPGTPALRADARVLDCVRAHVKAGKCVAAICAAPAVLVDAGVLGDYQRTCHFSVADDCAPILERAVVSDGPFITSRGAGTAVEFGLAVVARLCGEASAQAVAQAIHFSSP